jgi:alpha-tubulin suppressor-like RCC1 family protein
VFSNVRCWGSNASRQLGQASGDTFSRPAITGVSNVTAVASGARHTCALRASGMRISVSCWGDNTQGQVGTGVADPAVVTPSETPLNSLMASSSLGVVAGAQHTCAWDSTSVFCWGDNTTLALGRSMGRFNMPGLVDTLTGTVAKVVAGEGFTCANIARGAANNVWCWGAAANGRNGLPTAVDVATPTMVPGLSGVIDIAAGRAHACALLNTGYVQCWGDNRRGQLGVAAPMESRSPLPLASMLRFDAIAAGGDTTCGLVFSSRAVVCWGDNTSGQLAISTTTTFQFTPQRVMF